MLQEYRRLGFRRAWSLHTPRRWADQTVVVLVMQALDNSVTTYLKRGLFGRRMTSRQGVGEPNPSWIPVANATARSLAERLDGVAGGSTAELAGIPLTAGFIGKWNVFSAAWSGGYWPLVVAGVLVSAVAAYFYVRVIVLMFFTDPADGAGPAIAVPGTVTTVVIAATAAATVVLGIVP